MKKVFATMALCCLVAWGCNQPASDDASDASSQTQHDHDGHDHDGHDHDGHDDDHDGHDDHDDDQADYSSDADPVSDAAESDLQLNDPGIGLGDLDSEADEPDVGLDADLGDEPPLDPEPGFDPNDATENP